MSKKILPLDVKLNCGNGTISIYGVDPIGFVLPSKSVFEYVEYILPLGYIDEIVAWAYNLGYDNGLKYKGDN